MQRHVSSDFVKYDRNTLLMMPMADCAGVPAGGAKLRSFCVTTGCSLLCSSPPLKQK